MIPIQRVIPAVHSSE